MTVARVALVSPYALSVPGGAQSQVRAMSLELARRGLDVIVCSPGLADPVLAAHGVVHVAEGRVLSVPANGSRAPVTLSLRAARTFASIAATLRDGVVHVHEPFAPLAAYGVLRAHRQPTVGTFHRGGGGPAYVVGRPVIARLSRGLDATAAVSEYAARTISAASGLRPEVLFNGLDLAAFDVAVATPTTAPTIAFVGRHEDRKGLGTLLEALRLVDLPVDCWVLGAGPQTAALRQRFGSDSRVQWLGARADDEVRARMKGADVVCVPSLGGESFGLVPLEAMAAGTAVVASDIDGYREAIKGYATLVAPGDPRALADALRVAITTPATPRSLTAARAHAANWSMSSLVDRYLELYDDAIAAFSRSTRRGPGPSPSSSSTPVPEK
jgi:phosphatidyl-myo-inositol alpha-mannosyltransferase